MFLLTFVKQTTGHENSLSWSLIAPRQWKLQKKCTVIFSKFIKPLNIKVQAKEWTAIFLSVQVENNCFLCKVSCCYVKKYMTHHNTTGVPCLIFQVHKREQEYLCMPIKHSNIYCHSAWVKKSVSLLSTEFRNSIKQSYSAQTVQWKLWLFWILICWNVFLIETLFIQLLFILIKLSKML